MRVARPSARAGKGSGNGSRKSRRGRRDGRRRDGDASTAETQALQRCASHCDAAFAYCTTELRDVRDLGELRCLADCAQMCGLTAAFVARGARFADALRSVCAQQCAQAAAICAGYPDDEVLAACGEACRDAFDALSAQATPKV